jgi:hypothetical protein
MASTERYSPLYFVETQHSSLGRWFIECDRDKNSRAQIIGLIRSGEVDPVKVLEVIEDEGTCRDVTEELKADAARVERVLSGEDLQETLADFIRDRRKHEVA